MKERLDVLLVKRKLADSREKAKAVIMAGNVFVDGQREDKAGSTFPEEVDIEVRGHVLPYVSRGGLKLEKALKNFDVDVRDKVCTDVGSSTGGFTDCMLQNGAKKVYAIDVGRGQLDWKLRGSCVTMSGSCAWRRPISAMFSLRISENRWTFHQSMCHLSH